MYAIIYKSIYGKHLFVPLSVFLQEEGYDIICCLAVNDPFVMSAWADKLKTKGKVG